MKVIAYKMDSDDAVIMEIPATNPLTVNTVLAPNLSFSGVARMSFITNILKQNRLYEEADHFYPHNYSV